MTVALKLHLLHSGDLKPSQKNLKLNKNAFTIVTVTFQVENVPTLLDNHYKYY